MDTPIHYEESILIPVSLEDVFTFIDDHNRFSSHMNKPSWMLGGGKMEIQIDEGKGQVVGSHIHMKGAVLGIDLSVDEVITEHTPPYRKVWQTIGNPKLLVIGRYQMGIELIPENNNSRLKVFIDYDLPSKNPLLGKLLGKTYAKWCVRQMIIGTHNEFIERKNTFKLS